MAHATTTKGSTSTTSAHAANHENVMTKPVVVMMQNTGITAARCPAP
ncbi:hypothetical protein CPCC7001_2470 [Cyanobium sp. PCC 7001]|nr:hypothetical protein CPCC7001_2470 [Cyanobium sp. PCC 7001]